MAIRHEQTSTAETTYHVPVRIDGAPPAPAKLTITQPTFWLPNPFPVIEAGWEHIDSAGHWHGFTGDAGVLPTLTSDTLPAVCRGACPRPDCPGVHLPRYTCRLCGEPVTVPLRRAGAVPLFSAVPMVGSWVATIEHGLPRSVRVQARFFMPDGDMLVGVATTGPGRLTGDGELTARGAAGVRVTAFHQVGPA